MSNAPGAVGLAERLREVRRRIAACVRQSGRQPEEITLVGISKAHPARVLINALESGITDLGESRVQEAEPKILEVGRNRARWHLVGHLQANKARRAVKLFDVIHSIDSASLARRLDRMCLEEGVDELAVLIQVDLAGEETKSGSNKKELPEILNVVRESERLRLIGLMTLPPFLDDPEAVRPFFKELRMLRDEFQAGGYFGGETGQLSMGMTHDFEVAIAEGATMLRIGTAIFGEREAVI